MSSTLQTFNRALSSNPFSCQMSTGSVGYSSSKNSPTTMPPSRSTDRLSHLDEVYLDCSNTTCEIVADIVNGVLLYDSDNRPSPSNKYVAKMRQLTAEMADKHEYLLNGMMLRLEKSHTPLDQMIRLVADELFADGKINWGRVVSLFTFVQRLARYAKNQKMTSTSRLRGSLSSSASDTPDTDEEEECNITDCHTDIVQDLIWTLTSELEMYVNDRLGRWIVENGGWDAFLSELEDQEIALENMMKRGLVVAAVGGFAALAGFLALR